MYFNDIYYFYLIATSGGYTAAERASGITKSLLSRRIAQLEKNLNVLLIQRNSRNLSLTSAGKLFLGHATEMVREGKSACESVTGLFHDPVGEIRISCPTVFAQQQLAPLVSDFMTQYPQVRIFVVATNRPVNIVKEGFDLALQMKTGTYHDSGLIVRTLARCRLMLIASPDYLKQHNVPGEPTALNTHKTISSVLDPHDGEQTWLLSNTKGMEYTLKHKPALFCMDPVVQLKAALGGIGIGLIPEPIVQPALMVRKLNRPLLGFLTMNRVKEEPHMVRPVAE